jgi:hypothetical protein
MDLWDYTPTSGRYDWDALRKLVVQFGARNSLLIAPMPTASTSQILGNNESFEPYNSNVYTRRVLAGEFICVNPHLVKDLIELEASSPSRTFPRTSRTCTRPSGKFPRKHSSTWPLAEVPTFVRVRA